MNREKLRQALDDALGALGGHEGAAARLAGAQRVLERIAGDAGAALEPAVAALERARVELEEASALLERVGQELELEGDRLEVVEERLFALRAAARKHRVTVDGLAALRAEIEARVTGIDAGGERLAAAAAAAGAARAAVTAAAARLSAARVKAAGELTKAVMAELPPLRLDKARFQVRLIPLAEADWSGEGAERVAFEIATNPGQEPGPLAKVASGGELARLMLALKVVLAQVARRRASCSTRSTAGSVVRPPMRSASASPGSARARRCWSSPMRRRSRRAPTITGGSRRACGAGAPRSRSCRSAPTSGGKRSPACWPAPRSPRRRAPRPPA